MMIAIHNSNNSNMLPPGRRDPCPLIALEIQEPRLESGTVADREEFKDRFIVRSYIGCRKMHYCFEYLVLSGGRTLSLSTVDRIGGFVRRSWKLMMGPTDIVEE
jgi:hypothetical protein